jgi:conjugal transfer pilus assembly protein TraB
MNIYQSLLSKWGELEPNAKKIWKAGITFMAFIFSWQIYSNYEYHVAKEQSATNRVSHAHDLNSGESTHEQGSFAQSNSFTKSNNQNTASSQAANNSLNANTLASANFLPQTNRNMGLEEIKADFDYTKQLVDQAREQVRLLTEQNAQLQAKVSNLERAKAVVAVGSLATDNNYLPIVDSRQPTHIKSKTELNIVTTKVDLSSPLPSAIDFGDVIKQNQPPNTTVPGDVNYENSLSLKHPIKQWHINSVETVKSSPKKIFVTIPATSVIDAVMLSGINARTSATGGTTGGSIIAANNVGSPFITRVKGAAILPNGWRVADLTDCFLSGTGIGILSTERANVTADKLTCIDASGLIFESKIKAYGVDLDGIQGLSGRLVTKQGSILAKEAAAGMFAGVGSAFSPQALPGYNSNAASGSTQGYVLPNPSLIAGTAIGQGVSSSLGQLSKFYLDYARQMFPIVEVNAGTRVSWVVQESFDLLPVLKK